MKQKFRNLLNGHGAHLLILVLLLGAGWFHRAFFSSAAIQQAPGDDTRVVIVDESTHPGTFDELHATLVDGTLTRRSRQAVVLSDSSCVPDAEGISHCLNELSVGESRVTIQHHHRMARVPCLRPGETVTVVTAAAQAGTDV